jgi:ribokinase
VFDVVVLGSANVDLVVTVDRRPVPGETVVGSTYAEHPGGKGLNQAVAAGRAGAATAFVGVVGSDPAGDRLLDVLAGDAVDATGVTRTHSPTGRALIVVDRSAENSIVVVPGANGECVPNRLPSPWPSSRIVLAQLEIPATTVAHVFRVARAAGARTVLNPSPVARCDDGLLSVTDIVVPNVHEVDRLGGARHLLDLGASAVVVTRGAEGVDVFTPERHDTVAAFAVDPVDTTGAGDAFAGALVARLAAGDVLADAVRWAAAAGALATTARGAVPSIPHRRDVDALAGQR